MLSFPALHHPSVIFVSYIGCPCWFFGGLRQPKSVLVQSYDKHTIRTNPRNRYLAKLGLQGTNSNSGGLFTFKLYQFISSHSLSVLVMASNEAGRLADASSLTVPTINPPGIASTAQSQDNRIGRVFPIRIYVPDRQPPQKGQQCSGFTV